jgi:uncharacterized membrane protein YkoI
LLPATVLALVLAVSAVPLAGMAGESHDTARKLREAGAILPLEDILSRARAVRAGEILETELERKKGHYIYEVEILDGQGRVWELKLDAKSGDLVELELED